MIKYRENRDNITQSIEIEVPGHCRQEIESKINDIDPKHKIFNFEAGNKIVYKTEVLIPKVTRRDRLNLLMVLGNPAIHSVAEKMFFSYEKTRNGKREHRFWKALRYLEILKFDISVEKPTPENNRYKRDCLLNGNYCSEFKLPYLIPRP